MQDKHYWEHSACAMEVNSLDSSLVAIWFIICQYFMVHSLMSRAYMFIYVHWAMFECRLSPILPHFPACGLSSGWAKGELRNYLISYIVELNFTGTEPLFP